MQKPATIDPIADEILRQLSEKPEAAEIVLGGYFALSHYVDYRQTHDIDAWWKGRASPAAEKDICDSMHAVCAARGFELRKRRFGETVSFEMCRGGRKEFSFQIAIRSVSLETPSASPWPPVLIETLADNVGSKMNALVDRGAPRDFLDIRQIVTACLLSASDAWALWSAKNPSQDIQAARQKVLLHLSALESRRPLASIPNQADRELASQNRQWFREEFLTP